jgi:hypothetical protein
MRWGLVAIVLAACNSGQGVDIEIHSDKPMDAAELWLAYDYCRIDDSTKCDGIAWPGAQQRQSGLVFTLGSDEKVVRTQTVVDGVAELHLETTADQSAPIAIAVVAFSGGEVVGARLLEDVEIPTDSQAHWRVELKDASSKASDDPTADPTKLSPQAPTTNAMVWARNKSSTLPDPTGYAGCLAYQKWSGDAWDTFYFVPSSDPDCDGDPPDCNPYWYDASVANARCVTNPEILPSVCALGSLACTSETERVGCAAQVPPAGPLTCVGSAICEACGDSPDLPTCLRDQIAMASTNSVAVPMQRCLMQGTTDTPCINNSTAQGWTAKFVIKGGPCAPATVGSEVAVIRSPAAPFMGGAVTMTLPNGPTVTVHPTPLSGGTLNGCQLDLTYVQGGLASAGPQPIVLAVSYGPTRQLLIPVVLDFSPPPNGTCPTASNSPQACTPLGPWPEATPGDSQFSCTMP